MRTSYTASFADRHIGPDLRGGENTGENKDETSPSPDLAHMLTTVGVSGLEQLLDETLPADIRIQNPPDLPTAASEEAALAELKALLSENDTTATALLGQGYYNCHVPAVIQRNLFENPAWYTAYTPYQPEISQGRLEMLFNFQTLVTGLTGLPFANASLLDEATAVAEAVLMAVRAHKSKRNGIVIGNDIFRQTLQVVETRAAPLGLDIKRGEPDETTAALVLQIPDAFGVLDGHSGLIAKARRAGALVILAVDPLSLLCHDTPGDRGADIAVGSMQRFGVPLGYGGPHAAFMSCTDAYKRLMPGRLIGLSLDAKGRPAYRLALQTREQHIRREKATSNICTAQALLANMSAAYAIYHGPEGLTAIAGRVRNLAEAFATAAVRSGLEVLAGQRFDTVTLVLADDAAARALTQKARAAGYLLFHHATPGHNTPGHNTPGHNTPGHANQAHESGQDAADRGRRVSVSFDETLDAETLDGLCRALDLKAPEPETAVPAVKPVLRQAVFHAHRSETRMMRYLRKLSDRDLALDRAMIPLGSCTMKLNAAAEMLPVGWPEITGAHPFIPRDMARGTLKMIAGLEHWLAEITGFAAVSFQPNAGSQGEYAGLLAIRAYHAANGQAHRNICLIPASAHGTNPASAVMAGMKVVGVRCDSAGNIDVEDLEAKAAKHAHTLAALMVTYPSTHGVFEAPIRRICKSVHDLGGQVYLDGANLNAMVGLARPGDIGGDVCHMNLHKTFCIPHGGGGPGVGPIGVAKHLVPFLPGHLTGTETRGTGPNTGTGTGPDTGPGTGTGTGSGAVSATAFGSASILPVSWMYIRMMGGQALRTASAVSILSANYIAERLAGAYPVLYRGTNGRVAHECILDIRPMTQAHGVTVDDVAKRLIDYGFHAPTMSWPVAGTLMVEPTESEPLEEIDRFCAAMLAIADEAERFSGRENSPLKLAPFTVEDVIADDWPYAFSRTEAVSPQNGETQTDKYFPPVSRVDNAFGDRNLICTCPTVAEMAEAA